MLSEASNVLGEAPGWSIEGAGLRMAADTDVIGDREIVALAPTLLATARYLMRSEADAEDLVQATLEIAVHRRNQLQDPARLRSWLLTIEMREAFPLRRRLRSLVSLDGRVLEAPAGGQSDEDLVVRMAVAKLPARMRAAVVLHPLVSLSVAETERTRSLAREPGPQAAQHARGHPPDRQAVDRIGRIADPDTADLALHHLQGRAGQERGDRAARGSRPPRWAGRPAPVAAPRRR